MREVLLVPMQPTPNGPLHLGHAAGTYLRADAVARALAVGGHRVSVITGSDAFENWVQAAAAAAGTTAQQVCARYHTRTFQDLRLLGVQLDAWIDPLAADHYPAYRHTHEQALGLLQDTGGATREVERVPYTPAGQPVTGTWITGRCPHCRTPAAGSSCTACGNHFQPEELLDPTSSRPEDTPLQWRPVRSWFARPRDPDQLTAQIHAQTRPVFAQAATRYARDRGGRIRLTGPGTWGITSPLAGPGAVLANAYYLYAVYCGQVYSTLPGRPGNPFTTGRASTIGIFGHDNTMPGLLAPHVLAQASHGAYRPFDHVVVHGMLTFDGRKCSTSRRHGPLLGETLQHTSISPDELRLALAGATLDTGTADLTLPGLAQTVTAHRHWTTTTLLPAADHAPHQPPPDLGPVRQAVEAQHTHLDPARLDLPAATQVLQDWMHATDRPPVQWLLGLALLAEPITPTLARQAWAQLGYPGTPALHAAAATHPSPRRTRHIPPPSPAPVTAAHLQAVARTAPAPPPPDQPTRLHQPT